MLLPISHVMLPVSRSPFSSDLRAWVTVKTNEYFSSISSVPISCVASKLTYCNDIHMTGPTWKHCDVFGMQSTRSSNTLVPDVRSSDGKGLILAAVVGALTGTAFGICCYRYVQQVCIYYSIFFGGMEEYTRPHMRYVSTLRAHMYRIRPMTGRAMFIFENNSSAGNDILVSFTAFVIARGCHVEIRLRHWLFTETSAVVSPPYLLVSVSWPSRIKCSHESDENYAMMSWGRVKYSQRFLLDDSLCYLEIRPRYRHLVVVVKTNNWILRVGRTIICSANK